MKKGVILAGGKGTRLQPATFVMNKHLIPVLNRPMIEYPIETLKALGITKVMIVSGGDHIGDFADYLGDGSRHGVELTYRVQCEAGGIAQALGLAEEFVGDEKFAVVLGDNVFDNEALKKADYNYSFHRNYLFVKPVHDPERFGVYFPEDQHIQEKPKTPTSNLAVTGLYIYTPEVFGLLPRLIPSSRGELEITDLNNMLLSMAKASVTNLEDIFWSDAGTPDSLCRVINWVANQGK